MNDGCARLLLYSVAGPIPGAAEESFARLIHPAFAAHAQCTCAMPCQTIHRLDDSSRECLQALKHRLEIDEEWASAVSIGAGMEKPDEKRCYPLVSS